MFKYLNTKRFYFAVGKKKFWEFIVLAVFILFFYGPLLNMIMMAFANEYEPPHLLATEWGTYWCCLLYKRQVICIPAAFSLARFKYPGRKLFMLSFLLTNAFPKIGIFISIGVLFYKYNLMGTLAGVVIIHMITTMMFMVWLPSSAFRTVHPQQEEAARDVGAGPIRTFFKVTLPMAMPGIAVATLYTFLGSMEEAQGTLLVGMGRITTMPVEMYGIIMDYPGQAGAVFGVLLMIPSAVLIFLMRKYIGPEAIAGGFKMK